MTRRSLLTRIAFSPLSRHSSSVKRRDVSSAAVTVNAAKSASAGFAKENAVVIDSVEVSSSSVVVDRPTAADHHPDSFVDRHIGPRSEDIEKMLQTLDVKSLDEVMDLTIPRSIRREFQMQMPEPLSEQELAVRARVLSLENEAKDFSSYIGMGYYNTITPTVIQRNLMENPGWYTQYTPYQPEISQGRLESLLNWQTMVQDLTALPVANASLLDEATAAAEALGMALKAHPDKKRVLLDHKMHPQTIAVVKTRARL